MLAAMLMVGEMMTEWLQAERMAWLEMTSNQGGSKNQSARIDL